jgi:hypothetical protein
MYMYSRVIFFFNSYCFVKILNRSAKGAQSVLRGIPPDFGRPERQIPYRHTLYMSMEISNIFAALTSGKACV